MPVSPETDSLLRHLAGRPGHDEVKADFRQLLIGEFEADIAEIDFEKRVPEVRGRLDALIGRTVFEAKSDLDREWSDVERRMPEYLADRERENDGERFVGIASDGLTWAVFELAGGRLELIRKTVLDPDRPEPFLAWLDGALALKGSLPPDAQTVRLELGRDSVAYRFAQARLQELWATLKDQPDTALKRQLWADLLKTVYGRNVESDGLWFQHTFLVVVAKAIALAVMGLPEDDPKRLLSGEAFAAHGINGAVESDFFDWVIGTAEGEALVRRIVSHVRRFRLSEVESDVLKILYESLIDRDERHGLGEYYTPDWLAAKVVREATSNPLEQRVFDPACGSGTFLFHAVRNFVAEAETAGLAEDQRASEICDHVAGIDIHPVAVIIARVTYLLALAPVLAKRGSALSIPVYLGDAMQLSIKEFMTGKELTIRVPPPPAGEGRSGETDGQGREQLDFPDTFCRDPGLFDKAIEQMRTGSQGEMSRRQIEAALFKIVEQHYRRDPTKEEQDAIKDLGKTYVTFDRLRREGRDTVWAYVARNLSRPLFFSARNGWAHVVVGNPPWVALRHMNEDLQRRFRELAKGERVYVGGRMATQNDLCALFTVRAAHLYLRSGGRIAFVLPLAALTRGQFKEFRRGAFQSIRIGWEAAWTMDDEVRPMFPVPSCVVFGRRQALARPVPETVRAYTGDLPRRDADEDEADRALTMAENAPTPETSEDIVGSPYRKLFRNGATLYPRFLCLVERRSVGRLGTDPSAPYVMSRRGAQDKEPWKSLPSLESRVEAGFLRPVLLGESILPFRVFRPFEGVIPATENGAVLGAESAANHGYSALNGWMRAAEAVWDANKKANDKNVSLIDQLNYYGKLSAQFPLAGIRVVYAKAGTLPAACVLHAAEGVIDHKLYWYAPTSREEADYLAAVLNSEAARSRFERYQSLGQFGPRDFDKVAFNLPIPRFDPASDLHRDLAAAGREAERLAAGVELPEGVKFQRARKLVRTALLDANVAQRIDGLVQSLLDPA